MRVAFLTNNSSQPGRRLRRQARGVRGRRPTRRRADQRAGAAGELLAARLPRRRARARVRRVRASSRRSRSPGFDAGRRRPCGRGGRRAHRDVRLRRPRPRRRPVRGGARFVATNLDADLPDRGRPAARRGLARRGGARPRPGSAARGRREARRRPRSTLVRRPPRPGRRRRGRPAVDRRRARRRARLAVRARALRGDRGGRRPGARPFPTRRRRSSPTTSAALADRLLDEPAGRAAGPQAAGVSRARGSRRGTRRRRQSPSGRAGAGCGGQPSTGTRRARQPESGAPPAPPGCRTRTRRRAPARRRPRSGREELQHEPEASTRPRGQVDTGRSTNGSDSEHAVRGNQNTRYAPMTPAIAPDAPTSGRVELEFESDEGAVATTPAKGRRARYATARTVLDVVAEDPEEQHVAEHVQRPTRAGTSTRGPRGRRSCRGSTSAVRDVRPRERRRRRAGDELARRRRRRRLPGSSHGIAACS